MAKQGQGLQQTIEQRQVQHLSPQQYLVSKLVEMPLTDLEQRVRDEMYENIALEEGRSEKTEADSPDAESSLDAMGAADSPDSADVLDGSDTEESAEVLDAMDAADVLNADDSLESDSLPVYAPNSSRDVDADIPIGDTRSFIEDLEAQIAEFDVDEEERPLIEYLIGSLDDRGFIDRTLSSIADDLLFRHNIRTDEAALEKALHTLQQFDPVGIGARDLRECLLLQIDRQLVDLNEEKGTLREAYEQDALQSRREVLHLARRILKYYFSLFERNETERLASEMGVSLQEVRTAIAAIAKLNPHPGRSLHEAADDRVQTIVPDFIVDTDHETSISLTLNHGEVPPLHVSADYVDQLKYYQQAQSKLSRSEREAYVYTKQKVEAAQMFIAAIRQRQQTLTSTMRAIIALQRTFFLTQDEWTLRPMRLRDVADRTGLNISTISRVVNSKYVLLDGVLYSLKYFFLRTKQNAEGDEINRMEVYPMLREIIGQEDKRNPLSDSQIVALLHAKGQVISRRTVAKYRNLMKIPAANMRKRV